MKDEPSPEAWLDEYFERYRQALFAHDVKKEIIAFRDLCLRVRADHGQLIFAGNGASASISSHAATDFTKQGGVRATCFNEATLITTLANDYGYENWVARALEFHARPGDAIVLISSSGRSANMVKAAQTACSQKLPLVTLTGFAADNPLKAAGDINFWVNSRAYNVVENTHSIWLTAVIDLLIGEAEYPTSEVK